MHRTPTPADSPAAALKARLDELRRERRFAALNGLLEVEAYRRDLDAEVTAVTAAFVGSAVTEIATLRAGFDGALQG